MLQERLCPLFYKVLLVLSEFFVLIPISHYNVFYPVTSCSELVNKERSLLGDGLVRGLHAFGHPIFINQSIRNLVLCVFLLKGTLLNMCVCVCVFNPSTQNSLLSEFSL